jgi:hypothetical protein
LNGIFEFKIDNIPVILTTRVMYSDTWFEHEFRVPLGAHKLEWVYKKMNQYGVSDDLSAEIEYIQIEGV